MSETTDDTTTVEGAEVVDIMSTTPESADDTTVESVEASITEVRNNESVGTDTEPAEDADTFPREYVERLRRESQNYRERATKGDTYAQRLHAELVRATGRLADPSDLPFDEDHLADADTMAAAIDQLLQKKPHLASRRAGGDIGQGSVSGKASSVDLAALLRQKAH